MVAKLISKVSVSVNSFSINDQSKSHLYIEISYKNSARTKDYSSDSIIVHLISIMVVWLNSIYSDTPE